MSETFAVGDLVNYIGTSRGQPIQCRIVKVMPKEHAQAVRTYHVRDSAEVFDRAVPEFTLTRVEPDEATLVFKS
jgi:hypothetical protein